MKNKYNFIVTLMLTVVFLFYRVDAVVAMETEQNVVTFTGVEAEAGAEQEQRPGQTAEAETELEQEQEQQQQPEATAGPEGKPGAEQERQPEEAVKIEQERQPEEAAKIEQERQPEEAAKIEQERQPEETTEAEETVELQEVVEFETKLLQQPAREITESEIELPQQPEEIAEPETVSDGEALVKWLEAHKNSGGTVRLADHLVLDGEYSFYPDGINSPDIFVDTEQYTITVTGEISFLSDGCLTFLGEPEEKGVFYVAEKGVLSLYGISVESGQCALWQEEGAGLEVSHCPISGNVHYADTPFAMYYKDFHCAVVESGLAVRDVLPSQISCTVNRQGQLSHNEWLPVSWNLEGTEKQQEERRRFEVQGSFLQAASAEPIQCTVVYNDYPLTFTDVEATVSGNRYTFQGGFTVPEESLPFKVMTEYSFDGENWFQYEEQTVSDVDAGFRIDCNREQRGRSACFNIYIRLQWNDNGTRYFSNVLCYSADDLKNVEDIGGSRGGGTSITNPPDEPLPSADEVTATSAERNQEINGDIDENGQSGNSSGGSHTENGQARSSSGGSHTENGQAGSSFGGSHMENGQVGSPDEDRSENTKAENLSEGIHSESKGGNFGQTIAGAELSKTENPDASAVQTVSAEPQDIDTARDVAVEKQSADETPLETGVEEQRADAAPSGKNTGEQKMKKEAIPILVAAGLVLLSAAIGTLGFCVHSRFGTNR